ncbi:outer membrane beta-barrel protein [Pseudemcibacter aquimaris]|uniref:outer membrane beta-barrel protein n=1 Tax=Pseudemcibacter aquimaris TaxID=2857064 RepID=UPI00201249F7|nr:outer membrane beta-barrel protein [Pseudemcibacter aquimaris]MCC3861478.1 porin family protein [Pseudemcibacter aquimaris]WDU58247.1 porin family protein [Pseudemcibacter aquimaris]
MKNIIVFILLSLLPFAATAQTIENNKDKTATSNSGSRNQSQTYDPLLMGGAATTAAVATTSSSSGKTKNLYFVLEAGSSTNKSVTSGDWENFPVTNNSGGAFGATLGYREILENNWLYGFELSALSSSASSSVVDCCNTRTFDSKLISGLYLTAGKAMGQNRDLIAYALVGIGATKADSITTDTNGATISTLDENGNGFSFGMAAEFKLSEQFGIRVKALHNLYKAGEIDELRIRDTVVTGGLVINF